MRFITRNLLFFALSFTVLTIVMKSSIGAALDAGLFYTLPWIIGAAYGVITFGLGWFFGSRDSRTLPMYDAGFRYHLATFVVFAVVSELWNALGLMSEYDSFWPWRIIEIIWAVFVVAHFAWFVISRKKTIKGIEKSDLFD